jgi:hypothetical protein
MKYTVKNIYGIKGESTHRTPLAAIKAAAKREGDGWLAVDEDGNQWDLNGDQTAIVRYADE